ncbi:IclR family transcriptional regulator [Thermodesulfobacteriota bacterium]
MVCKLADTHRSVERALRLILAFLPDDRDMGTVELSNILGLPPSTVSRLLHILIKHGFLQQDQITKKYKLGKSCADIGKAITRSVRGNLVAIAKPHLDDLRNTVGDTVSLEVMLRDGTFIAYRAKGPHLIQVLFDPGELLPIHVAVGAKAVLAFSPPNVFNRLIKGKLKRFTPNTITNPEALKANLEEIRQKGYAWDKAELDINVYALGAPIFDYQKRPVAAIVIAAPIDRMKAHIKGNVVSLLKETAMKISSLLFYSEHDD